MSSYEIRANKLETVIRHGNATIRLDIVNDAKGNTTYSITPQFDNKFGFVGKDENLDLWQDVADVIRHAVRLLQEGDFLLVYRDKKNEDC